MELGKEIRRLRNDRGLTQEALACALNVSPQTVSKWECGSSSYTLQSNGLFSLNPLKCHESAATGSPVAV